MQENDYIRAGEILEVVMAYARMEFSEKSSISDKHDVMDAIAAGVNMLGEELQISTVSLREKEALLQEVHHRVKNNLQIISSLLNLQSVGIQDQKSLELMREIKNRINTMSLIHEMLYVSKDISKLDLKDYLSRLCQNVFQSFSTGDHDVHFEINIPEKLFLNVDKMIPLGLIVNEVVTNSFKYAFINKKGKMFICVIHENEHFKMIMSDNGPGFKEGFDPENTGTLGVQLIQILSEQIGGKLSINNTKGVEYVLECNCN